MARIRTIKPEFFTSEDIVELSPMARLLYIALWCEADREGRMAWKPRTFKMRYFPADDCNVDELARELIVARLVVLYDEGLAYIPSFARHQHVNPRETASILPNPDASARVGTRVSTATDAQVGREGEGRERNEEDEEAIASLPPKPAAPASAGDDGAGDDDGTDETPAKPGTPNCPHQEIIALYHELLPSLTRVRDWTDARQSYLRKRWNEAPERQTSQWWREFFVYVAESDFLMGRKPGRGGEPFECDLEWLVRPKNFVKVVEGKYENRRAA